MFVKTLFAFMATLMAAALVMPTDAEAKRLGGGMSLGKQYNMPRSAPPPRQAQRPTNAARPAAAGASSGASRWLGPLAGLAAGGLLASLLFGDAFEGVQLFDILLIAALVIGGVMLFKAMRRSAAAPAGAGAHGGPVPAGFRGKGVPVSPGPGAAAPATARDDVPTWFDGPGFVEGSKTHFIRLQAAWDQSDFRDIREYTAPQLYAELKRERERLGPGPQYTEVVTLDAELLGVQRDGDQVVASIRFTGLIREEEGAGANAVNEIWHVQHDWDSATGDWLIVGIQQG